MRTPVQRQQSAAERRADENESDDRASYMEVGVSGRLTRNSFIQLRLFRWAR